MVRHYLAVAGLALACYVNALFGDFVHDDIVAIMRNPDVLGTSGIGTLLTNDFWGTSLSDPRSHKSYRPLTTLSFRLNYWLCGLQPVWFHLVNVLLHVLSCLLFTRAALTVLHLDTRFATVAGLLFASHPVHTEAVAGVVGRADVLACVLFLTSFLIYHSNGWRYKNHNRLVCSCLCAALSMLAKETGLTVLLVNLAFDLYKTWPHIRRSLVEAQWNEESRRFLRRAVKLLMMTSVLLYFRVVMLRGALPRFSDQDNPPAFHPSAHVRFLSFCHLAVFNCWLLLCPSTLSHDWQMGSIPLVTSLVDSRNLLTAVLLAVFVLLVYRCGQEFEMQRHAPLVLAFLLLVIPFLPATNMLFTVGFVVAERVLYIPSTGAVLFISYGAQLLYRNCSNKNRYAILLCLLLLGTSFSLKTLDRNRAWSSRETLVREGLKALPHNAKMHYNFANFLRDSNSVQLAIAHYKEALRLWPGYASAHNNLGTLMSSLHEAETHFSSAIRISPSHVNAHYNLGQVFRKMNRTAEAVSILERCLRLDSSYTPAYLVLAKLQPPPIAARLLYHVTRLMSTSPDYQSYFADWLHKRGVVLDAQRLYMRGLQLDSRHLSSFLGLARCYRARGQHSRLQQLLIRWYLLHRGGEGGGRLVYAAELYVRPWDLYKPSQTTSHQNQHTEHCKDSKPVRSVWWNSQGAINCSKPSCKHPPKHDSTKSGLLQEEAQLTTSRLCVDQAESPNPSHDNYR